MIQTAAASAYCYQCLASRSSYCVYDLSSSVKTCCTNSDTSAGCDVNNNDCTSEFGDSFARYLKCGNPCSADYNQTLKETSVFQETYSGLTQHMPCYFKFIVAIGGTRSPRVSILFAPAGNLEIVGVSGNGTADSSARKYKTLKAFSWDKDGNQTAQYILERTVVEFYVFFVSNNTSANVSQTASVDFTINVDSVTATGGFGIESKGLYQSYAIIAGLFAAWILCATGSFIIWYLGFKPRFEKKYGIRKDAYRTETEQGMNDEDNYKTTGMNVMDTKVPLPKKHQDDNFSPLDISSTTLGGLNHSKLNQSIGQYDGGDNLGGTKDVMMTNEPSSAQKMVVKGRSDSGSYKPGLEDTTSQISKVNYKKDDSSSDSEDLEAQARKEQEERMEELERIKKKAELEKMKGKSKVTDAKRRESVFPPIAEDDKIQAFDNIEF